MYKRGLKEVDHVYIYPYSCRMDPGDAPCRTHIIYFIILLYHTMGESMRENVREQVGPID